MDTKSNYELLINKLDQFIRKFYINKIIRGGLYTVGAVIMLFLLFTLLEYFFYFGTGMRKLLFFGFIFSTLGMLSYWVIQPLLSYFNLGKTISHEKAAHIIGHHFEDVKDKLLNILQLKKQVGLATDKSLIEASINQKTSSIKIVPFKNAIDLTKNRKHLRYALPPFMALLVLFLAAPSLIKDGTSRIINNNVEFEKAAPFHFDIKNEKLEAVQFEDYTLEVETTGDVIPNDAFIKVNDFQYRLNKNGPGKFSYTFKNVQKEATFKLFSGKVASPENTLDVLLKPNLSNISIDLDYPGYTGRRDETILNTGDLVIPEGTSVKWNMNAINTDDVSFSFNGSEPVPSTRQGDDLFYLNRRIKNNQSYKIYIDNNKVPRPDSVRYAINVIKDQFPVINVEKHSDSLDNTLFYFLGSASDDYGLKELTFNYTVTSEAGKSISKNLPLTISSGRSTSYDYVFDISELNLNPGDNVKYFFEIKDNDLVNGSKSARTGVMIFEKPSLKDIEELEEKNQEEIKEDLLESIEESKKMQEELKKLREKLLQKKELNWQDKKEMENLLKKQKELQEKMQSAKDKFEENMKNQQEFNPQDEEIQKKQEQLKEMFDEVMDPETQELMKKIEDLLQELNKEDAIQMMEDMEMSEEIKEMEMDRLLELYKQLEMEKELTDQAKKLEELAEKQEKLAEETAQKEEDKKEENQEGKEENKEEAEEKKSEEKTQEELIEEQKKINEEFEEIEKKMEELEKKNEELNPPKNMDEQNEEKMDEIQEDLESSEEQMKKKQNSKASKSQKNAAKKMKNMAGKMMEDMESGEMEQMEEDIAALRQLLENLVALSFDQENLTNSFRRTVSSTPKYVELLQDQFKLKSDFDLIQDSLTELSKRRSEIESFVTEKVAEVNRNMDESLSELEERLIPEAIESQRGTMKNVNDLALMLSESMEQMQAAMSGMMPGSQMCDKPGGKGQGKSGNVPMDKITEGQQGLQEDLKGMKEGQEKGEGLGSKDFAQAAARQAALRKALEEMRDGKSEEGKGSKELQEIIDQMDKIEEDLVNKRLDNEMLNRQQDILTRLLEADKADRQREYDNKRKAEQAQEKRRELPPSLQDYLKKRESEIEMFKTISPDLKPYYKYLVDEYYRALKGGK